MGAWGPSIYSCDIAEDVQDACKEIYSFYTVEEGNRRIISAFHDISGQDFVDDEYASFWYVLADWQWKHGLLNQTIKEKALQLLDSYAGLDEWEGTDVSKRKKALDKLKQQLLQPQPDAKKPRATISKPKHMPGDVIIFKACTLSKAQTYDWDPPSVFSSVHFQSSKLRNSSCEPERLTPYNGHEKWMAVLCVGSVKEKHSEYVDNIFDEYGLYVWYDYLSLKRPSIDILCKCGFLPYVNEIMKDFNNRVVEFIGWEYEFTLECEKFKKSEEIDELFTIKGTDEAKRYKQLLSFKEYPYSYASFPTISSVFLSVYVEKCRAMITGEAYDNLLDSDIQAPQLLSPEEVTKNYHERYKRLCEQYDETPRDN